MTLYLDNNATTPIDPRVLQCVIQHMREEYGNAGSPHEFGIRSKDAVSKARDQIGHVVDARRHEVVFTSGATESNNLAILGLAAEGERTNRRHIVSTQIEHKAVLEPLQFLKQRGFETTLVASNPSGQVTASEILNAVRADTLLVSVMDVNNETGVQQPINEIANGLLGKPTLLHVDAAQGFGKTVEPGTSTSSLANKGIDLISISGHKLHAPQGIGALIVRRDEKGQLPPLTPLQYGGGQELGLRAGTLPVALIAGFGYAAELAQDEGDERHKHCEQLKNLLLQALEPLTVKIHGDQKATLSHVLNVSFPGIDADRLMELLADVVALSDGAACTTICATASHVLSAMGIEGDDLDGAVRFSWSYRTDEQAFKQMLPRLVERIQTASDQ